MRHFSPTTLMPSAPGFAAFLLILLIPSMTQAADMADGYRYTLHESSPLAEQFDKDPSTFDRVTDRYVAQAPEHTLVWGSPDNQSLERATFARGERRMGLFVPRWEPTLSPADGNGWTSYGRPMGYKDFDFEVKRGGEDRTMAGGEAKHYVLEAEFASRRGDNSTYVRTKLSSDLWVLEDKSFSFVPFATDGMYGDPRLSAALFEELSKLGMVVRAESRVHSQPEEEDGTQVGRPRDDTHLAWVTDLQAEKVPAVSIPTASESLIRSLRDASREDPEGTCQAVMKGETPGFVSDLLDDEQQGPFMGNLKSSCERRAKRKG